MRKVIDVSPETREGIRKVFKVTDRAIWNALNYDKERGQSDTAKRIRQYARMNGGVEAMVADREDTLLYDHNGNFRQYFPKNRAVLEFEKKTGKATLYWKGDVMAEFEDVRVSEMETLQLIAQRWTEKDAKYMSDPDTHKDWETRVRTLMRGDIH